MTSATETTEFKAATGTSVEAPDDPSYTVPLVVSKFSSRCHPLVKKIYGYSKVSCDRWLKETSDKDVVSHNGAFAACGGFYNSWVYPGGDFERVKVVSDFYSCWVFVDDLIDNTTDMSYVSELLEELRKRSRGEKLGHEGFDFMHRLYTHPGWHPEALRLTIEELDLWRHCTVELRLIENEKRAVSIDEYFVYRQTNAAMGMMYQVINFTHPHLSDDWLKFNQLHPDVMRRIFSYCGITMGIVLDLYKLNADHAQVCDYMHVAKVIQFASPTPLTLSQAVDKSIVMFHEYEDKLGLEYEQVALFSPQLAQAMVEVHAGSLKWLELMRGTRYVKQRYPWLPSTLQYALVRLGPRGLTILTTVGVILALVVVVVLLFVFAADIPGRTTLYSWILNEGKLEGLS